MANDHSFDIVSKVDFQEISNAIQQVVKELAQRFDLKDSGTTVDLKTAENKIHINSQDEYKLKSVIEILNQKMVKRGISPKALKPGKIESSLGGTAKIDIEIQQGIAKENAKIIVNDLKNLKTKPQTQIQEDQIRVISKKIDDLQVAINFLKEKDYNLPLQFINYR